MPGQTPIYGFLYPCPGEVVNPSTFQVLANQIDAKLLELQADYILMLNRKNFDSPNSAAQTVNAGVDTVLTSATVTYTVPMSGLWIFYAHAFVINVTGTVNSHRLHVRQNGVVRFGEVQNTETNLTINCDAAGPINAVAGDVISLQWLFNGTNTEDVIATLDGKMLVRTA
jgi:hypothetical protein